MRRDLGLGAIGGGLLMDDLRDAQQRAAVGPGGNRIAKSFVRPLKRADADLFVITKRGLVADAVAEVEGQAFPGAVLVHELSRRPVLGR